VRDPQALINPNELGAILGDRSLRVFDCTTTTVGSDVPYVAVPGREAFEEAHIPGADFLDIQGEFSDQTTKLRCMLARSRRWKQRSDSMASVRARALSCTAPAA
jgi:thiosulfate/3-mercaptopyruvate sulfurtransferase